MKVTDSKSHVCALYVRSQWSRIINKRPIILFKTVNHPIDLHSNEWWICDWSFVLPLQTLHDVCYNIYDRNEPKEVLYGKKLMAITIKIIEKRNHTQYLQMSFILGQITSQ